MRLIHFTLKEYFSTHSDIFSKPHSAIAEICLTYLNSQQNKTLSATLIAKPYHYIRVILGSLPFLKYCSLYWGVHAKRELSGCARSLALEFLRGYKGYISAVLLLEKELLGFSDMSPLFNGLHYTAELLSLWPL